MFIVEVEIISRRSTYCVVPHYSMPSTLCQGNVSVLAARGEHEGIATHEVEGESPKQLAGSLTLSRPLAPCQAAQQLHLCHCVTVSQRSSLTCVTVSLTVSLCHSAAASLVSLLQNESHRLFPWQREGTLDPHGVSHQLCPSPSSDINMINTTQFGLCTVAPDVINDGVAIE